MCLRYACRLCVCDIFNGFLGAELAGLHACWCAASARRRDRLRCADEILAGCESYRSSVPVAPMRACWCTASARRRDRFRVGGIICACVCICIF